MTERISMPGQREARSGGGHFGIADLGEERQVRLALERWVCDAPRVLDPFAGVGTTPRVVDAAGGVGFGVEAEEDRVLEARERLSVPARMVHGDAARLPFAAGTFDAVITNIPYPGFDVTPGNAASLYGRHYSEWCAGLGACVEEAVRVVREGGVVVLFAQDETDSAGVPVPVVDVARDALARHAELVEEAVLVYDSGDEEACLVARVGG